MQRKSQAPPSGAQQKPAFSVRPRFYASVELWKQPVRVAAGFLCLFFLMPELKFVFGFLFGLEGAAAVFVVSLLVLGGFVLEPLVTTALNYSICRYDFFADRLEYTNGYFLREKITIPWHQISDVQVTVDGMQRRFRLGNLVLLLEERGRRPAASSARARKPMGITLPDIRHPEKVAARIRKDLWQEKEPQENSKTGAALPGA